MLMAQGLLPVAVVYLSRELINGLVAAFDSGGGAAALRPTLLLVALLAGIMLVGEALRGATGLVQTIQAELVEDHVTDLLHGKALELDLGFYETADYYDQLYRARVDALSRPTALVENLGSVLQNGLTLIAMAGVLLTFGVWLPLVLILSALPALAVVLQATLRLNGWRLRSTADRRRTQYYTWMLTQRETAAELRLFGLGGHFRAAFLRLRLRLRGERIALARSQAVAEAGAGGVALLTMALALAWMAWRTARGQVTLGDLALFYQAFSQGQRLIRTLLGSVSQIYANSLFLENLHGFLALEPTIAEPARPVAVPPAVRESIHFDGVTFRYPGSERAALDNFSVTFPAGKTVALVGENGMGKSTLIKLLCRFYDPEQGSITWDGRDLRELSLAELRRSVTVLFQEPVHYHETARNNIAYGDWAAAPTADAVEAAARSAGADVPIARLPDGYETVLGKWFSGAELSGGEWQRVALARAFLRPAALVILDEPTSAMDSWAEAAWLARFRELVAGRAAIIITHRFTTALQADLIHVMDRGQIIESGTHAELLARDGRYARSWHEQMRGAGVAEGS